MKNILKRLTFKRSDLGEGISYDGTEQTLTWVDIPNSKVFEYNKNANCKVFTLGAHSSFVAKTINNHYLSGGSEGLTLDGKFVSEAIKLENDIINDGSVHPSGESLIFGSRDYYEFFEKGSLWILGKDITQIKKKFKVLMVLLLAKMAQQFILLIHQKGLFIKLNLIYRKKISKI